MVSVEKEKELIKEMIERIESSVKDEKQFDLSVLPKRYYRRKEMDEIISLLAHYVKHGIPLNIIIYGSKGSGKTFTALLIAQLFKEVAGCEFYYVNARDFPTTYSIFSKILNEKRRGFMLSELRERVVEFLEKRPPERKILIIDDVHFLRDTDILYFITRETHTELMLLTQNVKWFQELKDESVKTTLLPNSIVFNDYNADEIMEILRLRAEDGLKYYEEKALRLISAITVRDYHSDTRIAIRALYHLGLMNKWNEESVKIAVKKAVEEVEHYTVLGLPLRDLIVLYALMKNPSTNEAYLYAKKLLSELGEGALSKQTFLRIVNHLQNIGLVLLATKKKGRYYTFEAQVLVNEPAIIENAVKRLI